MTGLIRGWYEFTSNDGTPAIAYVEDNVISVPGAQGQDEAETFLDCLNNGKAHRMIRAEETLDKHGLPVMTIDGKDLVLPEIRDYQVSDVIVIRRAQQFDEAGNVNDLVVYNNTPNTPALMVYALADFVKNEAIAARQ